jgi:hypothetical protein
MCPFSRRVKCGRKRNMTENDLFLGTAIEAARRAEAVILDHAGKLTDAQIRAKAAHDYVTLVDQASEAAILATGNIVAGTGPMHALVLEAVRGVFAGGLGDETEKR